jgi:lipid-A-disaccharide synthase
MVEAVSIMNEQRSDVQFVLVVAPGRTPDEAQDVMRATGVVPSNIAIVKNEAREALAASDAAAIASGTATLEAALLNTPLVVVYKESPINWHVLGSLINAEHYGLVNLIAQSRLATELIQSDFTGPRLAVELLSLLESERNAAVRKELEEVATLLGAGGASKRAATAVLKALGKT